ERLQDAHHLDHHGAADAVVGRARAGMPRVEVRPYHDDLVAARTARNLADDVSAIDFLFGRPGLEIDAEPHRLFLFEEPRDPTVVFSRDDERRRRLGITSAMRTGGFGREHSLARTFVRNQNRGHAFGSEEPAA